MSTLTIGLLDIHISNAETTVAASSAPKRSITSHLFSIEWMLLDQIRKQFIEGTKLGMASIEVISSESRLMDPRYTTYNCKVMDLKDSRYNYQVNVVVYYLGDDGYIC